MVVGHKKQWDFLTKAYKSGLLPHALLFSGPEKIGKKTLAMEFVKFLNCLNPSKKDKACGVCENCVAIDKKIFPDVVFLEPDQGEMKIAQIRNIIWSLSLKPYFSKNKMAIVDSADLMNQEAQNCFLKFLEEPKGDTSVILISSRPDALLTTILSRVQKINFFLIPEQEIKGHLLKSNNNLKEIDRAISFCQGKPGRAKEFLENPAKAEAEEKAISDFLSLARSNFAVRFSYVKKTMGEEQDSAKERVKEILDSWLNYLRMALLGKTFQVATDSLKNNDLRTFMKNHSRFEIAKILRALELAIYFCSSTNANQRLVLENFLIKL
jgi:DNA polymerase III subunit delta'